jgi:hypothetical protein
MSDESNMADIEYVRDQDRQEYLSFIGHHLPSFVGGRKADEVWHYTSADGLIGMLKSGEIWSTQVTCLNDTLEMRYFINLVHDAVKTLRAKTTDADLSILFRIADERLTSSDLSTVANFVACFSEVEDDLAQWRGYGGGECGYAVGFQSQGILEAIKGRRVPFFLPMHYEDQGHKFLVDEVLRVTQQHFQDGLRRELPDAERWAREIEARRIAAYALASRGRPTSEARRRLFRRLLQSPSLPGA